MGDPFSPLPGRSLRRRLVQSKQLQPDYVSSHHNFNFRKEQQNKKKLIKI